MSQRYRVSDPARVELSEIWVHIAMDSPTAADRLAEVFYAKFGDIARHPGSGRRRDDLGAGVRTAVVGNYLVLYRQADVGVEILHVAHGARDIQSLL